MKTLFNDGWEFAEKGLEGEMTVPFVPDQFFDSAVSQSYKAVTLPHDWQIYHVKDLYRNSVGFYKKSFELDSDPDDRYIALNFEGVYMNCAVWVNGKKAGEWKYGYSSFYFDVTGNNTIRYNAENCPELKYQG